MHARFRDECFGNEADGAVAEEQVHAAFMQAVGGPRHAARHGKRQADRSA